MKISQVVLQNLFRLSYIQLLEEASAYVCTCVCVCVRALFDLTKLKDERGRLVP